MCPGYLGRQDLDAHNKHSALSGSETSPGQDIPSQNPQADEDLKSKIENYLEQHVDIDTSNIKVFAKNGTVSLTGLVSSPQEKADIEGYVQNYDGVGDVVSLIEIDSNNLTGEPYLHIPDPS